MTKFLRIDSSASGEGSNTRKLADTFYSRLGLSGSEQVTVRDVSSGLPVVTGDWVGANFTPEDDRSPEQKQTLALSDSLIAELEAADVITIGVPIYNFGVPASLKAWIDLVARARKTFRYTENGPEGLLTGKKAVVFVASGGTEVNSAIDFATPYIKHVLGFIGIHDVTIVAADRSMARGEAAMEEALTHVEAVTGHLKGAQAA